MVAGQVAVAGEEEVAGDGNLYNYVLSKLSLETGLLLPVINNIKYYAYFGSLWQIYKTQEDGIINVEGADKMTF